MTESDTEANSPWVKCSGVLDGKCTSCRFDSGEEGKIEVVNVDVKEDDNKQPKNDEEETAFVVHFADTPLLINDK